MFSHKKNFFPYSHPLTFNSTMKNRDTSTKAAAAAVATASNSDGETIEKLKKTESDDENAAMEKSKPNETQAENAEENISADKSAEDVNVDKDAAPAAAAADETDAKKTGNGKKLPSDKMSLPRKFIRLTCVHCRTKSVKFQVIFGLKLKITK